MNHSQNKNTVRLLIEEALNKGNTSILEEIIHPGYLYTSPTEQMKGVSELKAFVLSIRKAFADLTISIDDQIAEGDKVCTRISMKGTHSGDFLDFPQTGKKVNLQGVIISKIEDGLIKEEWELLDQLTLLQQLGITT